MIDYERTAINFIPLPCGIEDEELRKRAKNLHSNGSYTSRICKRCGRTWHHPKGDVQTAKITEICSECVDMEEATLQQHFKNVLATR